MPRRTTSPTMLIVNFFMSAPIADAEQALDTAKAIVNSRKANGLQQPVLPGGTTAPKPRKRRERKPRQTALPGTEGQTQGTQAPPTAGAPVPPQPRRRRSTAGESTRRRPSPTDTPAPATDAVAGATSGVDLSNIPQQTAE